MAATRCASRSRRWRRRAATSSSPRAASKPILQGDDLAARSETRAMTAWVLGHIVHLLHPIMPFITEKVWEHLAGTEAGLLLTARWPEFPAGILDPAASAEMEWVVAAI